MKIMILRNFEIGDEGALWEVFYSAIHKVCAKDYTEEQINAWAPDDLDPGIWVSKIHNIKPIVAVLNHKIVGYSDLQPSGLIDHFFVHGDYQQKGVGGMLMSEILERGSLKKMLYSEVSHTARAFYEKYEFNVVKEQTVNMRGVLLNNYVMERPHHLAKLSN
jgi:putative acetyltransferase